MKCTNCKEDLKTGLNYCPNCGKQLVNFKKRSWKWLLIFPIFFFIIFPTLGLFGLITVAITSVGSVSDSSLNEQVITGSGIKKIAVIPLSGVIQESESGGGIGSLSSSSVSPQRILKVLESLKKDNQVVGVILRINSPGGTVTGAQDLYGYITKFKKETGIPIVSSMGDLAASGGYYIALSGDYLIASPTTLTGSIGAIIESVNLSALAEKYGVASVVVKSGKNKDLLNPLRPTNKEEVELLQKIVDQGYEQFWAIVKERRKLDDSVKDKVADGRVLSGLQAKEASLVDNTGDIYKAIDKVKEMAGVREAKVVEVGRFGFLESLLSQKLSFLDLSSFGRTLPSGVLYLYRP